MNVDRTLLKIFEAEQQEHLGRLRALLDDPGDGGALASRSDVEEALRRAHTLKGAARAVGVAPTEHLAHRVETVFARVRDGVLAPDTGLLGVIRRVLDVAEDVLASVVEDRPQPDDAELLKELDRILELPAASSRPNPESAPQAQEKFGGRPANGAAYEPPPAAAAGRGGELFRVDSGNVDALVRNSAHLLAAATGHANAVRGLSGLSGRLSAVEQEWGRLLARVESLPGSTRGSLNSLHAELANVAREVRLAAAAQLRTSWTLQQLAAGQHEQACRVRMTPAGGVFGASGKMIRDLAAAEGKEIDFRQDGMDVLADRLVLEALKDPLMHLLRNAVAHGIETPPERAAAGKPRAGLVQLRIETAGDRLNLEVADDGRGIDPRAVAQAAVRQGLVAEAGGASLGWHELTALILRPGFSTSPSVTRLAGRGMGMSVVHDAVIRLQGEVSIRPRNGPGISICLSVPLSISTQPVLLVTAGGQTFALASSAIEGLRRVAPASVEILEGAETIRTASGPVPLARLSDLLGIQDIQGESPDPDAPSPSFPVAVVRAGNERIALVVDRFLDLRHALVKELGLDAASSGMATGGVPLEDGSVALLLSVGAVAGRFRRSGKAPGLAPAAAEPPRKTPCILVVDDSITTRSLEKSMLEAHGYRVRVAVDGIEALNQIRAEKPDLVISDVMMPRMDGLQLLDRIKHDRDFADIPVILVTSLDKREEQERGLSLGADAYIVKQKFNQREMLNTIRQIL